jgi:hypothetical protein
LPRGSIQASNIVMDVTDRKIHLALLTFVNRCFNLTATNAKQINSEKVSTDGKAYHRSQHKSMCRLMIGDESCRTRMPMPMSEAVGLRSVRQLHHGVKTRSLVRSAYQLRLPLTASGKNSGSLRSDHARFRGGDGLRERMGFYRLLFWREWNRIS